MAPVRQGACQPHAAAGCMLHSAPGCRAHAGQDRVLDGRKKPAVVLAASIASSRAPACTPRTDVARLTDPACESEVMDAREVMACPPRARAGLLLSSQFPVNYFSISDVEQFFPEFAAEYAGFDKALAGTGKFWRFNRIHDYAGKARRPCPPPPYPSRVRVVPASAQWPCNGRSLKVTTPAGRAAAGAPARPSPGPAQASLRALSDAPVTRGRARAGQGHGRHVKPVPGAGQGQWVSILAAACPRARALRLGLAGLSLLAASWACCLQEREPLCQQRHHLFHFTMWYARGFACWTPLHNFPACNTHPPAYSLGCSFLRAKCCHKLKYTAHDSTMRVMPSMLTLKHLLRRRRRLPGNKQKQAVLRSRGQQGARLAGPYWTEEHALRTQVAVSAWGGAGQAAQAHAKSNVTRAQSADSALRTERSRLQSRRRGSPPSLPCGDYHSKQT